MKHRIILILLATCSLEGYWDPSKKLSFETCHKKPHTLRINNLDTWGLWSMFLLAIAVLHKHELVDIKLNEGLYFDAQKGDNWWEYYFEPITAQTYPEHTLSLDEAYIIWLQTHFEKNLMSLHKTLKKHIRIKQDIKKLIRNFKIRHNFNKTIIIGIHYRGTDRVDDIRRTPYETVFKALDAVLSALHGSYKIFVATDEAPFLTEIQSRYQHVISYESVRSTDNKPIHLNANNPYKIGEEAMVDALLLSECDLLLVTPSNLNLASRVFNPVIWTWELNHTTTSFTLPQPVPIIDKKSSRSPFLTYKK